ncbi:MAG: ABC transporter substrate-binding protein, partial [Candidatus Bathyarchaeota archaeon]|nr:ABC transporter substrate-binding protein [Candidatus Bathyarchaeota archaeon]
MIRKKWRALTVGCCLILILTVSILILASTNLQQAQIPITSQPKTVTVVDDLGRNVTVKYPVERIVSLASSISEVICAIGYEEGLVGVDAHSTFPPILKEKVNLGSGATPSVELTVGLQPDIVFAWYY